MGSKLSELEQIREKMGLTLDGMAEAMGTAHSTIHRWESAPGSRSAKKALEAARALYKKKFKQEWKAPEAEAVGITREEFNAVLKRLSVLESGFQAVALTPSGLKDLDERVRKVERHAGFRE